jgi:hypothetical protein
VVNGRPEKNSCFDALYCCGFGENVVNGRPVCCRYCFFHGVSDFESDRAFQGCRDSMSLSLFLYRIIGSVPHLGFLPNARNTHFFPLPSCPAVRIPTKSNFVESRPFDSYSTEKLTSVGPVALTDGTTRRSLYKINKSLTSGP